MSNEYIPYIIASFRGGISDEYTRGILGSYKYGYSLDIHKRRDSLSCNWKMFTIGASSAVNDLVKYTISGRDGSVYAFGNAGSVYAIAGNPQDPTVTFAYNDDNGEIKGAAEWKQSDGNVYLHWATNTSIARMLFNGSPDTPFATGVVTQDYKTLLDASDWHFMKNAAGNLSIANANFLATIDYQGNFNPAAMNVRPGNILKSLDERDDYVLMGSERVDEAEEGHLWAWVTTDLNWFKKKRIPAKGVNSIIDTELLLAQAGNAGEIFYSDFANYAPLIQIPDGAGKVNPQGVAIYNDLALFGMWGTNDDTQTGIYSYGRRAQNRPMSLNYEFRLAETTNGNTVREIGAIWVSSSAVFASYKVVGSANYYGIDMVSTSTRAFARYEGLEFNGGSPHLNKHFQSLKVAMEKLPSGTSLSILWKKDRATTSEDASGSQGAGWKYAVVANSTSTSYSTANSAEAEFIIDDIGKTFEVGVELTPSGSDTPEILALVGYISNETEEH